MKSAQTFLFLLFALTTFSQSKLELSKDIIGNWQGEGTLFGNEADFRMGLDSSFR
jgi:hypothetical protein